jgi:pro-apoptotic serine protease NMA111
VSQFPARQPRATLLASLALLLVHGARAEAVDPSWDRTLERVASAVVSIDIDQARAFDTEWNSSGQATGFVVDAERGLILTNRHVVTPGPVVATAVFQNREEVELRAVYRDPVHDFGIYRYDPAKLRYNKPAALPLYPEGARIGTEIRVIGNDAGEQLSILAGTLARLDREAPDYGSGKYNDFNTFYYQAASGTSGGSSGSPVVDIRGRVVALNAGGSSAAASSFYLPLWRVQRALQLIQQGRPITRGTLQTVFSYTPFDELQRLGLPAETEAEVRRTNPDLTGMLVVREVQPGSPAVAALAPGDVLLRVDGALVTTFDPLAEVLDGAVGRRITLELQRGGQLLSRELEVQDLDSVSPARYLEFGDSVVHTVSWQMARHFNQPVRGVFVANPGYTLAAAGVPRGAVITRVNGTEVATLDDFAGAVARLGDGARATLRFFTADDPTNLQTRSMHMDRRWFPARECRRDDASGYWPCTELAAPTEPVAVPEPATTSFAATGDKLVDEVASSLVLVQFNMPFSIAGVTERNYHGTGVIIDAERGLVVVDRNTVPVAIGDVRLTIAGSVEVPGRVEYVHPLHNLAVVSFDRRLLGATPLRAARFETREVRSGEAVTVVGLGRDSRVRSVATSVASLEALNFPLSRTLQFRESNLETIGLVNAPTDFDGVIVGRKGEVLALWSSFAFEDGRELRQINRGIPAGSIVELARTVREGRPQRSLGAELQPLALADARRLGLPEDWLRRLEEHSPDRRQALSVVRTVAGTEAASLLRPGDLLLAVNDRTVNRFDDVAAALAANGGQAQLVVWRDDRQMALTIATESLDGRDVDRLLLWAGAVLHAPHRAMAAQRAIAPEGVFVAYFAYGSPATRYKLFAGRRIVEVDGKPTLDLDAFVAAVQGRPDRSALRLKTIAWNGAVDVITLKLDNHYWPAYELRRTESGWNRTPIG